MRHFEQTNDWRPVYEALYTGIHVFAGIPGGGSVRVVRGATVLLTTVLSSSAIPLLMLAGDVLEEEGRAVDVYGVRIGDEL